MMISKRYVETMNNKITEYRHIGISTYQESLIDTNRYQEETLLYSTKRRSDKVLEAFVKPERARISLTVG